MQNLRYSKDETETYINIIGILLLQLLLSRMT